jgi:hypothetical protein
LLSIIYTINLPVVRPRSYRVIYYFDTPALGRRHQSFGRVSIDSVFINNFGVSNESVFAAELWCQQQISVHYRIVVSVFAAELQCQQRIGFR